MSKKYFSLLIKKSFQLQEKKRLFGGADKQKVHRYGHDCPFLVNSLFFLLSSSGFSYGSRSRCLGG